MTCSTALARAALAQHLTPACSRITFLPPWAPPRPTRTHSPVAAPWPQVALPAIPDLHHALTWPESSTRPWADVLTPMVP